MALVYPPTSTAMLASVDPADAGVASGAVNSLREIAGALGIAVLAWVFTASGGAAGASAYVSGLAPALFIGAGVLASGVLAIRRLPVGDTADRAPLMIAADGIAASDPLSQGIMSRHAALGGRLRSRGRSTWG